MPTAITHIQPGSIAERLGLREGDLLEMIGGEPIIDQIDYQALSCHRILRLVLKNPNGHEYTKRIIKDEYEPLGLQLEETLVSKPRHCRKVK